MSESVKTMVFVATAVVLAALAGGSYFLNQPTNSAEFEMVGKPFFPDFETATDAKSLSVAALDPDTATLKRFRVENKEGVWRIPSHYDYPAEAAERLAATATSVMGIERESLAGRLASEHERLGVLDPLDEDVEDPESAGQRLTFKDSDDEVVVDFIIGKEIDEEVALSARDAPFGRQGNERYYYVRRADENPTYKVKLDIDLSTKFSDWIDPDLLRVGSNEVTRIEVNNYSIEEDRSNPLAQQRALFKNQGDVLKLSRPTSGGVWELEGLKADTEELQTGRVDDILGVLDELKIAGVRPKVKFMDKVLLTADLKLNRQPEFEKDPQGFGRAIDRLQGELERRGFNLAGSSEKMELVSQFGEMTFGTNKGVVYTMHIGKAVEGGEEAIEVGGASTDSEKSEDSQSKDEVDAKADETEDSKAENSVDKEEEEVNNRFLLVRVALDESLITPQPIKPTEPIKPVAPDDYTPKTEPAAKEGGEAPDDVEAPSDPDSDEPPAPRDQEARKPEFVAYDEVLKKFDEDKIQFGLDMTQWEDDKKAFAEKVKESQKVVDELNERFGDWYYVMSGDNLKTLRTEREDLVSKKELPPGAEPATPARPDITFPDLPATGDAPKPPAETESPAGTKETPVPTESPAKTEATDPAKSPETSAAEPKLDDKKVAEPPAEPEKSTGSESGK